MDQTLGSAMFSSQSNTTQRLSIKNELARKMNYSEFLKEMCRQLCFANFNVVFNPGFNTFVFVQDA